MKNNFNKNLLIFWASQTVSQLGSSMTQYALILWAYQQTQSAMAVSLLTFSSYVSYSIASLFVGSFVDRHQKKNIMAVSDSIACLCSLTLAALLFIGKLQLWHLYIGNAVTGLMNAFQSPAAAVALGLIIPKNKLSRASGMNSLSSSMLAVVTPMLAAFLCSLVGLQGVILFDMLTFGFAFFILLAFVRIPEMTNIVPDRRRNILKGCRDGVDFLRRNKSLWYLILSISLMNFFSRLTYENILPAMLLARSGGNNSVFGIVSGLLGFGGIAGGIYVSFCNLPKNNIKTIYFFAAFSFIAGDMMMGLGQNLWLWSIAGLAASVPIPFINASQNVIFYHQIPTKIQGSVFAVRNAVQYATIPLGLLLGGLLADTVFEPFMQSDTPFSLFLQRFVGSGAGSGMAVMFLCTGILGFSACILCYSLYQLCIKK